MYIHTRARVILRDWGAGHGIETGESHREVLAHISIHLLYTYTRYFDVCKRGTSDLSASLGRLIFPLRVHGKGGEARTVAAVARGAPQNDPPFLVNVI